MSGAPFWGGGSPEGPTFSPDPWDIVFIGGDPLPGICEVKGIAQLEVDKKKAKGSNGVTLTVTGYQPGPFEVSVRVWTPAQWDFLQDWIDKFWVAPQKARPATVTRKVRSGSNPDGTPKFVNQTVKNKDPQVTLDIDHPACSALGITTCVVQGIAMPEAGTAEGEKVVKIKLIDGRANEKKTVTKTAKGSSNDAKLTKELRPKEKEGVPPKPSQERADLGPAGPRAAAAGGSD